MLVTLRHVSKFFGQRCILKDVCCTVTAGTMTLLAGPNGAGKTTLLRLMAGLCKPTLGEVAFMDEADGAQQAQGTSCGAPEQAPIHRADMGYLGHSTFVYPGLTALENLRFWADIYGLKANEKNEDALVQVLTRVDLAPFGHEKAGVFSRGMAQRLNLARLLLLKPALWLLDEPCTGLDVRSAALLRQEVLAAKAGGAGIVWISHDLAQDGPLADVVLHIEGGRVEARQYLENQGGEAQ